MSYLFDQVFGKLITPDGVAGKMKFVEGAGLDSLDGDHDLKEHMVGILFSRSKLSHLQRQVCTKIIQFRVSKLAHLHTKMHIQLFSDLLVIFIIKD